jgi:RNA polymerase sigma-70 factor (ECF subfamily)
MLVFTFIMDEQAPEPAKNNSIEIDENLFVRIGKNDMEAFDELYKITERTLYAFSLSLTRDQQQSLDLMQDTYVKVLSASHLYQPMGKPLAWMFTIAKNIHYSSLRKGSKSISLEPQTIAEDKRFSYITEIDDRIVLEGVLRQLTQEEREIVLLYAVSGMKHREIAESTGLSLSTTLSKYHRALKKLRKYLDGKEEIRT